MVDANQFKVWVEDYRSSLRLEAIGFVGTSVGLCALGAVLTIVPLARVLLWLAIGAWLLLAIPRFLLRRRQTTRRRTAAPRQTGAFEPTASGADVDGRTTPDLRAVQEPADTAAA